VQAYAGLAASQTDPGDGEPRLMQHTAADKITALTAAPAISAALFARDRGRGGQHLRISMLEAVANFVWADAAGNEVMRDADGSQPSSFSSGQRLLRFKDGFGIAAPVSDADFAGICRALGVEGADDPRVATLAARARNREAVAEVVERMHAAAAKLELATAIERLEAERTPCGVVLAPAQLADDPHVRAIGMLEDSVHPVGGRLRQPRPPVRFDGTPAALGGPAPTLGQHTDEVLAELGRADEIASLRERGVVA
jgi:crotonobetainyl-CoA:carnitine CoA-transferase CaiB-like acyl-CoA transferase